MSESLHAPWRIEYLRSLDKPNAGECFMCVAARARSDDQRQAIWETVGVMRPPEQQWVQQQWAERLAFDPALFSAWTDAMARG